MVDQILVDDISERFRKGEKRAQITEDLVNKGWTEGDINEAIAHIQHVALQQMPVISSYLKWHAHMDAKTADLPPRIVAIIFFLLTLFLFFVTYLLITIFY